MLEFKISAETAAELAEKLRGVADLILRPERYTENPPAPDWDGRSLVVPATEPAPVENTGSGETEAPKRTRRSKKTEEAPAAPETHPSTSGMSAVPTADIPASPPSPTSGEAPTAEAAADASSSPPTVSSPATSAEPDQAASFEDVNRLARELLAKHPDRAAAVQQVVKVVTGTAGKIATIAPDQYGAAIAAFEQALADLDV